MPSVSAATSEPCSARSARPAGDSIRFSASHTDSSSPAPAIQYQTRSPRATKPNNASGGTDMPSGPPVSPVLGAQHDRDDDAQAERGHRQVVTLQAQRRAADHEGQQPDCDAAGRQRQPGGPAVAGRQDRRAVAAEREEAGVAEADLAGVADQQVQPDADDGVQRHQDRDLVEIVVAQKQRQQQRSPRPAPADRRCAARPPIEACANAGLRHGRCGAHRAALRA